jgi:flotillin
MDNAQLIGIAVFFGVIAILLLITFIKANVVICEPNEIAIISGKQRKRADGERVGYRVLRGGRGFKWPLIESVKRLPLTTRTIKINLDKVLCSGMIPIEVEGRANIKLAGRHEDGLENAIERFLGKNEDVIDKTAIQIIEGNVRGTLAGFTPEQANVNRIDHVNSIVERSRVQLTQLGVVLDAFQILSISDKHGHLEAIGRKRNSEVQKEAKVAEAKANAEARIVVTEQDKIGRQAEIESELEVIQKENTLLVTKANLNAVQLIAEKKAEFAGQIARAEEKTKLKSLHIDISSKYQEADVIIPAQAKRKAMILEAEGEAAKILEDGKATAKAIELMSKEWENGENHDLFMIRMLPELFDKATRVIADNLHVEKITILDGGGSDGGGEGLPNYVRGLTKSAVVLMEQLKNATGMDLTKLAENQSGNLSSGTQLPPEK